MAEQNIVQDSTLGDELNPKIDALRNLKIEKTPFKGQVFEGNTTSYRVFYSPDGQSVKVMPVDNNGQVAAGAEPIYENGKWYTDRMEVKLSKHPRNGKITYGPFINEEEREKINNTIKDGVTAYSQATGTPLPKFVTQDGESTNIESSTIEDSEITSGLVNESASVEQSNFYQNTENNNNSKTNKGEVIIFGSYNDVNRNMKQEEGIGRKHSLSDYDDANDIMFRKIVRYPIDMADNMDHMMIQCYAYQPPYAPAFRRDFATTHRGLTTRDFKLQRNVQKDR